MLKRSLYVRIVGTFITVVVLSVLISYFTMSFFFHNEVIFDEEVKNVTSGVAEIIELTELEDVPALVETFQTYYFNIMIFHESGEPLLDQYPSIPLSDSSIIDVFYSAEEDPVILPHGKREASRVAGIPIEIEQEPYALFLHLDYEEEMLSIKKLVVSSLLFVLLIGSLLILLASRRLVTPIKKLTNAAKEMAKGNFSVRLKSKDKDEVGELITSFNHMASEVEKIDKMREDFVSSVSHEIQSPLTSIRGFTKAIQDEVVPKQNEKEYLDIIYQETERLSRLSENLLRLASLDSEHHPYHPEVYKLDEQIRRTVLATEPQWKSKNLQILLELDTVEIYADQDLLEQVWLNLFINAIKYSPPEGEIHIHIQEDTSGVKVSIKDYGKGIPEEAIPYLFDRFFKVDKARTNSIAGNGLGLSIVKKIVMIHHFSIEVSSKEGEGSVFTVLIPKQQNDTGQTS
ncbi:HAMP domain-containing histidine kinase [Alkalihalobacillus sp. MEB130]|uniref:sensor histidine kinase n=1 Tax=Alkalihalobacillus sp. MEB130 TaxID=2976704 RepID=UPI0028DEBD06|nr:HAMP domain-containing sensor histidine kinase [Alkalihalobacillus sp. MEB130]MDT8860099.1 HAMP domain-containing histidine kinase [Alkalihalobacillus sp. MEB130]